MTSERLLRWLCWALVVFVIATSILTIAISQELILQRPAGGPHADLVDEFASIRIADAANLPIFLLSAVVGLGVFAIASVLGVALRPFAGSGIGRDVMAALFIVSGVIGMVAGLVLMGTNQVAAQGYCDCGYRTEELIAQAKTLDLGFTVQTWLSTGALTTVGVAAALAGRLVNVSAAWRTLSYGIAIALIIAAFLQVAGQNNYATILTGVTAGIFVTIWAIMLSRAAPRLGTGDRATAAS